MRPQERQAGDGTVADPARREGLSRPRVRFGPFEFDPATGELWRDGEVAAGERLPPQPALLLSRLIERRPRLVSRDEIRRLLWPEVSVEFEEGLHSCVRKIRLALGDSAATPLYVETVPRRGYRFIADVEAPRRVASEEVASSRRPVVATVAAGLVMASLVVWAAVRPPAVRPPVLRVAVMPFEPRATGSALEPGNDLAEAIVERLARRGASAIAVVGPTTTESYEDPSQGLRRLIADFGLDYVVNARETFGPRGPRVLVEIIRAADGAHVWVRYLDELPAEGAAEAVSRAVPGTR